jgi:hypothetical protein
MTGWAVGNYGTILYTNNGGIVDLPELNGENPRLEIECYPNPCSIATHLKYYVNNKEHVRSDLYQISGKWIKQLLNEEKMPGAYEMDIDVSNLTPGIYIVRMQTGKRIGVQKLVVN